MRNLKEQVYNLILVTKYHIFLHLFSSKLFNLPNFFSVQRKIQLRLPRFKMEFEAKMRPFLEEVGISDLFEKSKADLSDIADEPLYGLVYLLFQNQILNPKIYKKLKTKNVSSLNQSKHS